MTIRAEPLRATDVPAASTWIAGRGFDLPWFFGGAVLGGIVLAICIVSRDAVIPLMWAWILLGDGPHMAAAYTRTYADRSTWRERPEVLWIPLVGFAIGPMALLATVVARSRAPFELFLGAVTLFAYYHVVRQHWGFVALYRIKSRERGRFDYLLDRWTLSLGCWLPYFYLLITHPRARAAMHLAPTDLATGWERALVGIVVGAWSLVVATYAIRAVFRPARERNPTKVAYVLLTVLLYGFAYYVVARWEPVYAASRGPDTDFVLLTMMISLFHSVQYVGLVWLHNRNGYAPSERATAAGAAHWISRSAARYVGVCVAFAVVYVVCACSTGVFPGCRIFTRAHIGPVSINQVALSIWWGIALHHYLIDQRIWRVGKDATLKANLGL